MRRLAFGPESSATPRAVRGLSVLATFLCVVIAWVFFRATSLDAALRVLRGMCGMNGFVWPLGLRDWLEPWLSGLVGELRFGHLDAYGGARQWNWIAVLLAIVWIFPNSQTLISRVRSFDVTGAHERRAWIALGVIAVLIFLLAAINGSRGTSEFIYFNF
jgi:hypothetical protein